MIRSILPIRIFRVAERSMEPTIKEGDYVIVWTVGKPKIGEAIALKHPYKNLIIIKRILRIKGGAIYVVGDNGRVSEDSRKFGWIGGDRIIGTVVAVV